MSLTINKKIKISVLSLNPLKNNLRVQIILYNYIKYRCCRQKFEYFLYICIEVYVQKLKKEAVAVIIFKIKRHHHQHKNNLTHKSKLIGYV